MLGKFWMYGTEISEAIATNQGKRLIREVSRRWAVSDDWGDLELAWLMHLKEGQSVDAYWGFAKFQPRISRKAQAALNRPTSKSYEGGSIQLVLRIDETNRKWIKGPYRTVGLHAEKEALRLIDA